MELRPVLANEKFLGIGLVAFSLLSAVVMGIYFSVLGESMPLSVIAWPAFGVLVGVAILFSDFVEDSLEIQDELEQAAALLQDDIEELRQGRFTATHWYVVLTVLASGLEVIILAHYQKWLAHWGFFNVLFVALIVSVIALRLGLRTHWFQIRQRRLSRKVFTIPAVGFLICVVLGTYYAEPKEYGGLSRMDRTQLLQSSSYWGSTRASRVFMIDLLFDAGDELLDIDCDGEACLVLLLAVIVGLCIVGVMLIPHFWVVATMLLLTLMGLITLRELLYLEYHKLELTV